MAKNSHLVIFKALRIYIFVFQIIPQILTSNPLQNTPEKLLHEYKSYISRVDFQTKDIFGKGENFPLSGVVNFLHIKTRENVLRQEILFKQNEQFNRKLVDETERNLRKLGLFADVDIRAVMTHEDSVKLIVTTQDKWSTKLNTSYKFQGGVHFFGIGMAEDNLIGFGKSLDVSYNQSTDRIARQIQYRDPRLFGTRFALNLKFQNNSDFTSQDFFLSRPFFAWNSTWGMTFAVRKTDGVYRQFLHGELIAEPELKERTGQLIFNSYKGDKVKRHFMIGADFGRSQIGDNLRKINLYGIGFGWMKRNYAKIKNIDNLNRTEDVSSGVLSEFALGMNYQSKLAKLYFLYRFRFAKTHQKKFGFSIQSSIQSFYSNKMLQDLRLDAQMNMYRSLGSHLFVSRFKWSQLSNFSLEQRLSLGDENGLRGFNLRSRTGTKLLLFNIEDRIYSNIKISVFRLGLAAFVDIGNAWKENESVRLRDLKTAFGFGLQIGTPDLPEQ